MDNFRLGDDVFLKFSVSVEDKPIVPVSVSGDIYDSSNSYVTHISASNKGDKVSALIDGDMFTEEGEYTVLFTVQLKDYGNRTHAVRFEILPPLVKEEIGN